LESSKTAADGSFSVTVPLDREYQVRAVKHFGVDATVSEIVTVKVGEHLLPITLSLTRPFRLGEER